jgi:hypothetical protein
MTDTIEMLNRNYVEIAPGHRNPRYTKEGREFETAAMDSFHSAMELGRLLRSYGVSAHRILPEAIPVDPPLNAIDRHENIYKKIWKDVLARAIHGYPSIFE